MTTVELLKKAKGELETRGWTTKQLVASNGAVCLIGAVCAANGTLVNHGFDTGEEAALDVLREFTWPASLSEWNDTEDRTKEEVLAVFDQAIRTAEK